MPANAMPGPLDGIRVLEAGLLIQGPQAAALLADMGADVIKIELPGVGDQSRYITVAPGDQRSAVFTACNRGKRGISLDLRQPRGAEIFKALVRTADVFVSNFMPGTLENWGLAYEDLAAVNPGIICAQGSTFGPVGPDAERKGADLAGQAAGGLISTTGRDGDPPTPVGAFIADHVGSLNMVAGILAALHARSTTGRGQRVDVSLLGGQIWAQATEYTHYLLTDRIPGRANLGHPLIKAAYGIFETADGWIGLVGVPPQAPRRVLHRHRASGLGVGRAAPGHRPAARGSRVVQGRTRGDLQDPDDCRVGRHPRSGRGALCAGTGLRGSRHRSRHLGKTATWPRWPTRPGSRSGSSARRSA